jgi:hypothetical protein
VARQHEFQLGEGRDVLAARATDDELRLGHDTERRRWCRLDGVEVLLPEVEAEPRLHEGVVGGWHEDVVIRAAGLDPRRRRDRVQRPHRGPIDSGVARRLDPGIAAPRRGVLGDPDQVARERPIPLSGPGGCRLGRQERLDLAPRRLGRLVGRVEQRLGEAMASVALGEECRRGVEIGRAERPDVGLLCPHDSADGRRPVWIVTMPKVSLTSARPRIRPPP